MKTYTITVNGKTYEVTVEEKAERDASAPAAGAQEAAAKGATSSQTSAAQSATAPKKGASSTGAGAISIEAGAAGKIADILAEPGTAVSRGDTVLILEVMKMETPVVAPEDGTIASIEVAKGDHVAAGAILATMD